MEKKINPERPIKVQSVTNIFSLKPTYRALYVLKPGEKDRGDNEAFGFSPEEAVQNLREKQNGSSGAKGS